MEIKRVRSEVIMLPTENESLIWSHKGRRLYYNQANFNDHDDEIKYHLYFTTDEEIKEGDWCVTLVNKEVLKYPKGGFPKDYAKKIIATTDPSLTIPNDITHRTSASFDNSNISKVFVGSKLLPQPSQSFVKKYVELGGIDEVDIEYEECNVCKGSKKHNVAMFGEVDCNYCQKNEGYKHLYKEPVIKTDSYNTITIHSIKNRWSREEVEALCEDAFRTANTSLQNFSNWKKHNLK